MSTKIKTTETLRDVLCKAIEDVIAGSLEVKQAHAVSALSGRIVATAELDLKFKRLGMKNSFGGKTKLVK